MIEKLGFTPGPWSYSECKHDSGYWKFIGQHGDIGHAFLDNGIDANPEAIAKLMVAAPEMLEALIDICKCEFSDEDDHKKFTDIVEKATGKTWAEVKALTEA